jgi:hypothetical protein
MAGNLGYLIEYIGLGLEHRIWIKFTQLGPDREDLIREFENSQPQA